MRKRELSPAERDQAKRRMYPLALASGVAVLLSFLGLAAIVAGFFGAIVAAGTLRPSFAAWPLWCWGLVLGGLALFVAARAGARASNRALRRSVRS